MIYSTRLIGSNNRRCMKKTLLTIFLVVSLFPISHSFSQIADTEPTLGISLTSFTPYNYKDEEGYTVVLGEIENKKNFPISGVKIFAGFYDEFGEQPLETNIGTTVIEIIPPLGKSPYLIKSKNPNAAITSVSVNLLGFNSSPPKEKMLSLEPGALDVGEQIMLSGSITNDGPLVTTNTKINLIMYDGFEPPRVLGVTTISMDNLPPGATENFEFTANKDFRAVNYKLIAESGNYQSDYIDITGPTLDVLQRLVTINDISVNDPQGNRLPDVSVGSTVHIQSKIWIQYSSDQESIEQPYIYYVQIKESDTAMVEFIGKAEGIFLSGGTQVPIIEWTPQNDGLYFAETFVWDPEAAPLASKGPISLILVN